MPYVILGVLIILGLGGSMYYNVGGEIAKILIAIFGIVTTICLSIYDARNPKI